MSADSADDQHQSSARSHSFMMNNRGINYGWDEEGVGASNAMPRSPLSHDRANTFSSQRVKTTSVSDQYGRRSVATTYAGLPTSRSTSNKQPKDRSVSVSNVRPRSPYKTSFRFFLTVIPPSDLPQDPPHPRSQASAVSSSHTRRGSLLPLYPTLGGQLYAISREYGLPSIGGISLYLCDDGEGNLGPRVGDAAWSALWNRYFDDPAEDLYQDITSPMPSRNLVRQPDHDRQYSGSSGEVLSPFADRSTNLRREVESGIYEDASFLRYDFDRRPSSSAAARLPPFASGFPASPPIAYHTPSPRFIKSSRPSSHSSPYTSSSRQARLPIVGRIEWAVDKKRAPWWSNWIGEAEIAGEKGVTANVQTSVAEASSNNSESKTWRRSMHLRTDLLPPRATSPLRSIPIQGGREEGVESGVIERSIHKDKINKERVEELQGKEYQRISEENHIDNITPRIENHAHAAFEEKDTKTEIPSSHDSQSYAGYSVLIDADQETQARSNESVREREIDEGTSIRSSIAQERLNPFNANILSEDDESEWKGLLKKTIAQESRAVDLISEVDIHRSMKREGETSAVHEWIVKTQSPRNNEQIEDFLSQDEDEEALPSPQDDVGEVLNLWAEKISNDHLPTITTIASLKNTSGSFKTERHDEQATRHQSQSASIASSEYSAARSSPRSIKLPVQNRNEYNDLVKMDEPPELIDNVGALQPVVNKASLLSPIALDGSGAIFAGPSANLGDLLGHRDTSTSDADSRQGSIIPSTVDRFVSRHREAGPARQQLLSSPSLEVPVPHSPGAQSQHSSATDVSDTLLDMERALELLSPSLSNNNHGSPAVNTNDTTYEAGSIASHRRSKMPYVSSRESMARAKTLSTSVTPSPRWFRNTNSANDTQIAISALADLHSRVKSASEDKRVAAPSPTIRSLSTSTSTKSLDQTVNQYRRESWQVQTQSSAGRSIAPSFSTPSHMNRSLEPGVKHDPISKKDNGKGVNSDQVLTAKQSLFYIENGTPRLYESPVEMEGIRPQWLQPGEHLGKQGWSDSTVDQTAKQMSSRLQQQSTSEVEDEEKLNADINRSMSAIDAMFSPRSGEYATVGVQVEREEGDRTDSLFSLISDEMARSDMNSDKQKIETINEATLSEMESQVQSLFLTNNTSTISANAQMGQFSSPGSKEDIQPSIQRLLRGNSFAESSVASSKRNSVVLSSDETNNYANDTNAALDWAKLEENACHRHMRQASKLHEMITQDGDDDEEEDEMQNRKSLKRPGDGFLTNESGGVENDSINEGDWTVEGSEYDDNKFDNEEYEGEETSDSPATTRISRMSGYSHSMPMHNAGVSDAGGRTPTFFYDQHLADDEEVDGNDGGHRPLSNFKESSNAQSRQYNKKRSSNLRNKGQDLLSLHISEPQPDARSREDLIIGDRSFGSSRHEIVSMQGEPLNSSDDQMLHGFEQVSPDPADLQSKNKVIFPNVRTGNKSKDSTSSKTETTTPFSPFHIQHHQQSPLTPSLQFDQPDKVPTRRSTTESDTEIGRFGAANREKSQNRRASASATVASPSRSPSGRDAASFVSSPRRFKGAMLRLTSNMSNGNHQNNGQLSPRGNSPNQRFGTLPPSPSLPVLGGGGDDRFMMSPTHSYTGTRSTSGGTLHSPVLSPNSLNRNNISPRFDKVGMPLSPSFKFPAQKVKAPQSPNGLRQFLPLADHSNIVNTSSVTT